MNGEEKDDDVDDDDVDEYEDASRFRSIPTLHSPVPAPPRGPRIPPLPRACPRPDRDHRILAIEGPPPSPSPPSIVAFAFAFAFVFVLAFVVAVAVVG